MTRPSYRTGIDAEKLYHLALRLKFSRILAERYKTLMSEIDIATARGKCVTAVEVKKRAHLRFDVMLALSRRWPIHIKNAWTAI